MKRQCNSDRKFLVLSLVSGLISGGAGLGLAGCSSESSVLRSKLTEAAQSAPGSSGPSIGSSNPAPTSAPRPDLGDAKLPDESFSKVDTSAFIQIHVSPSGNDANPGTEAAPLQTLKKGTEQAISNRGKGVSSRIVLHPGVYRQSVVDPAGQAGVPEDENRFLVWSTHKGDTFRYLMDTSVFDYNEYSHTYRNPYANSGTVFGSDVCGFFKTFEDWKACTRQEAHSTWKN